MSGCGPVQSPLWLKRGVKVEVSQFILQWSNKNGVEWGGAGRGGFGGSHGIWFFAFYQIIYWEVSMRIIAAQEGGRFVSLS